MNRILNGATTLFSSFLMACFAVMAAPVVAADTPSSGAETGGIVEVMVTAQRRSESQARTPVAVAVVATEELAKAVVVSEQDLRSVTPGLSIRAGLNSNQLNYSLRGQSQDAFSGTRPGVLPYINEVQIGGFGGSSAFYDLQSVQVLKGPQGTLFGRSATGGAVLFTTAKPTNELSGYASGLAGDYSTFKFEGAVSGPLMGDKLLGRLAAFYQKRDGFQKNLFDGGTEGDLKRAGLRASLTANFSDSVKNDLVVDYLHSDSESTIGVISGLLPFLGGGAGNPPYIPIQFLYAGTSTPIARATGQGTLAAFVYPGFLPPGVTAATATPAQTAAAIAAAHGPGDPFYNAYFTRPGHDPLGIVNALAQQQARSPFVVSSDASNIYQGNNIVATNATTFDLGNDMQIKNILGLVHFNTLTAFEADGTSFSLSQNGQKGSRTGFYTKNKQASEELQLLGKAAGGRLSYVTGLYFSDEKISQRDHSEFFDLLLGGQVQLNDYDIKNRTSALYGQGTYNINDNGLAFTVGARETNEKVSKVLLTTDSTYILTTLFPALYSANKSATFKRLSWQVGIQDQVNPNLLLYAVSRRAYKSGGFNGSVQPRNGLGDVGGDGYLAERVTDVELGSKFQGELGNMPTRLNVALYHNWIQNSQRTAFSLVSGNPAALTTNVPEGKTYGAEFDWQIKPVDRLTLGGTLNYTHPRFTPGKNFVNVNGSRQAFDQVPDTPEFSGTVFADVTIPVAGDKAVTIHGDVYNQKENFASPRSNNNAGTVFAGYSIANFRVSLDDAINGWSLSLNMKNAFDKIYYVGSLPTGEIYQVNVIVPGEPRTITFEARKKF